MKLLFILSLFINHSFGIKKLDRTVLQEVTKANYSTTRANEDFLLIYFYSKDCDLCETLRPEFEKTPRMIAEKVVNGNFLVAQINCAENFQVCEYEQLPSVPSIKAYKRGNEIGFYKGEAVAEGIVEFFVSHALDTSTTISKLDELDKYLNGLRPTVLGVFAKRSSQEAKDFAALSSDLRGSAIFLTIFNKELFSIWGNNKDLIVVLLPVLLRHHSEEEYYLCDPSNNYGDLKQCVSDFITSKVIERHSGNAKMLNVPYTIFFGKWDFQNDPDECLELLEMIHLVRDELDDERVKINLAISKFGEFDQEEFQKFGINQENYKDSSDVLVITRDTSYRKYALQTPINEDSVINFIHNSLKGKAVEAYKSAAIPRNQKGPVLEIVRKDFENYERSGMDLFIAFYASSCTSCQDFMQTWDKLATFLTNDRVIVGKFNIDANDIPSGYFTKGLPTVFWKKTGESAIWYEGDRDLEALQEFVARSSTVELVMWDRDFNRNDEKDEL